MSSYFFQIIHNYIIENKRLELPKRFVRKCGEELSEDAVITDPTGKIWLVEMRKTPEGEIFLENGWQRFMDYFSLGPGHFLIFRYDGSSNFRVYICDMSACEIDYPCQTYNLEESHYEKVSTDEEDEDTDDLDVSVQSRTPIAAKRAAEVLSSDTASGSHKSRRGDNSESPLSSPPGFESPPGFARPHGFSENHHNRNAGGLPKQIEYNHGKAQVLNFRREAAVISLSSDSESDDERTMPTKRKYASTFQAKELVRKKANAFNSEIHKFRIIMRPSYVDNRKCYLVHIPNQFAKSFLTRRSQSATLRTSDGRVWEVECVVYISPNRYEALFRKGWKEFKLHNHLKEGDICEFELVDRDNLGMDVGFSRVSTKMLTS